MAQVCVPCSSSVLAMPPKLKQLAISNFSSPVKREVVGQPVIVVHDGQPSLWRRQELMTVEDSQPIVVRPQYNKGGRPKSAAGARRGVASGESKSNKREVWQKQLRRDPSLPTKLALASKVADLVMQFGSRDAVPTLQKQLLEDQSGWSWKVHLKQWWSSMKELASKMASMKIGVHGVRPFGSRRSLKNKSISTGARLRDRQQNETYQSEVLANLKCYLEYKRTMGVTVYGAVLRDHYVGLLRQYIVRAKCALVELQSKVQLLGLDDEQVQECKVMVAKMEKSRSQLVHRVKIMDGAGELKSLKYWSSVLARIGGSGLKPARVTKLSPAAVELRVKLTWQSHDYCQWLAVHGSDEELVQHVHSPAQWRANLQNTVIVCWDHAPVWCSSLVHERPVYTQAEPLARQARKLLSRN